MKGVAGARHRRRCKKLRPCQARQRCRRRSLLQGLAISALSLYHRPDNTIPNAHSTLLCFSTSSLVSLALQVRTLPFCLLMSVSLTGPPLQPSQICIIANLFLVSPSLLPCSGIVCSNAVFPQWTSPKHSTYLMIRSLLYPPSPKLGE